MFDIIGVGDSDVDLMIEVDHLPRHDEKVRGNLVGKFPGGIIGNFCCAAAKFGAKTGIVSVVGDDEFGCTCIEDYVASGVDIQGLVVNNEESTYFCIVLLDETGEKALTLIETPLIVPDIQDINVEYMARCRYLHLTSLDFKLLQHVCTKIVDKAVNISVDIESHADRASPEEWRTVLRKVSIVFTNDLGIQTLFSDHDLIKNACKILAMGPQTVVITRGSEGALIFSQEGYFAFPAFQVKVRDTTGAGDCFNAVFLSSLVKGFSLLKATRYATAAAALAIQYVGARTGFPTQHAVEKFLKDQREDFDQKSSSIYDLEGYR
jgi:sugar/nucleoside kinase (ribokinase family)